MKAVAILLLCAALCGCASLYPKPDVALIAFGQPTEDASWDRALAHANSIDGGAFRVAPTGSMEPFLTGGDCTVVDFAFPYSAIKPGMLLTYDANWLDEFSPLVTHMAVERSGEAWIMTGLANQYSESGSRAMTSADYRGRVVAVYTTRKKP